MRIRSWTAASSSARGIPSDHFWVGKTGGGRLERFQRLLALPAQAQGAAASDQHGLLRAGGEEPSQLGGRRQDVLEVVEHDQRRAFLDPRQQLRQAGVAPGGGRPVAAAR